MECRDVEQRADAYLDRELSPTVAGQWEAHLSACPLCRHTFGDLVTLLHNPAPVSVPAALRRRIMIAMQDPSADPYREVRRSPWRTPWLGAAAASILFFVLGWFASRIWVGAPDHSVQKAQQESEAPRIIVVNPWVVSGWLQAAALRTPVGALSFVAHSTSMEIVVARLTEPLPVIDLPERPASHPAPTQDSASDFRLPPILPPVLRL